MEDIKQPNEICEREGHVFETYAFHIGSPYDNYSEQAGHCKRCGYDTHE